jgi:DNA-binding GntR family transcriptional regulator
MENHGRLAGSLAEQAYLRIRDKILRGHCPLGAPLSRRKLAVEFKMSFLPVTEAIKRLESDGLVESLPRVGTRVRVPTAQDVRDRYVMREALETQSARLFAEKASSDERLELRAMAAQVDTLMQECAAASNPELTFRSQMVHLSFHMRIAECTGCAALCEGLEKNQVLTFNWLFDIAADYHMPSRWHEELIAAVAGADPDLAEAVMRRHVRHGLEEIQAEIATRFGVRWAAMPVISKSGAWRKKAAVGR